METHHQKAKPNQEQNQHHNRHSSFVLLEALVISWLGKPKPFVQSPGNPWITGVISGGFMQRAQEQP